jgi:2-polyprenyl-6-methoxyphenol hydroxylase-like FAD-dependent oxidoreductase
MRVLISGAGIAGPTMAWFLAKTNAHITIVEKSHSLLSQGQSIDIQGSAIAVVENMGLMNQIRQFNTTEKGTQFIGANGQPFALFPVVEGSFSSLTNELEILRGDLATILYEATKDHSNVNYLFNTVVSRVVSNDHRAVKVVLSNGDVREFDLLVAADGQWSNIRKQCFPPEYVSIVDMDMYTAYWTIPRIPSDNDWWNIYSALNSRIIALRPDRQGTTRALITKMPCNRIQRKMWQEASRSDRQTQEDLLRAQFVDAGWQIKRLLDNMPQALDFHFQAIQQIKMSQWSYNRIICLGDAAYAPCALSGMGTSLAITGAYVLAGELSKLNDGEDPSKALKDFETIFRPFVEETQKISSFIPAIAHPETAWKRWLLQALLSLLSKAVSMAMMIPWLAQKLHHTSDEGFPLPQYPVFGESKSSGFCNISSTKSVS